MTLTVVSWKSRISAAFLRIQIAPCKRHTPVLPAPADTTPQSAPYGKLWESVPAPSRQPKKRLVKLFCFIVGKSQARSPSKWPFWFFWSYYTVFFLLCKGCGEKHTHFNKKLFSLNTLFHEGAPLPLAKNCTPLKSKMHPPPNRNCTPLTGFYQN